jgi:hypothetical protein
LLERLDRSGIGFRDTPKRWTFPVVPCKKMMATI